MKSVATSVDAYLAELPEERRAAIEAVRKVIRENLDKKYEEGILYGMIGYYVPHSIYPPGYHCDPKIPLPFANLASQKNYMSLYMMCAYGDGENANWFRQEWEKTGKKLDMGKACIRFRSVDDLALNVIGEAIRRITVAKWIQIYESGLKPTNKSAKKTTVKAASKPKAAAKKTATKKSTAKRTTKASSRKKST